MYKIELTVSGVGAVALVQRHLESWGYSSSSELDGAVERIQARGFEQPSQERLRELIAALITLEAGIYGFSVTAVGGGA